MDFIDKPRTLGNLTVMTLKLVYLCGSNDIIDDLLRKRHKDPNCSQSPRKSESIPRQYHLRVEYSINSDGVIIRKVYLGLSGRWTCLFDRAGRAGTVKDPERGSRISYYLNNADCISGRIKEYERGLEISRLAMAGPSVFPHRRVE